MAEKEDILSREKKWLELRSRLKRQFGRAPDLNAILLLIGVQELGRLQKKFSKEQKQDLMHIATCRILPEYYRLEGYDEDGWPHFSLAAPLPAMALQQEEDFLRDHVIAYFDKMGY